MPSHGGPDSVMNDDLGPMDYFWPWPIWKAGLPSK
jgi:hypothetical protein